MRATACGETDAVDLMTDCPRLTDRAASEQGAKATTGAVDGSAWGGAMKDPWQIGETLEKKADPHKDDPNTMECTDEEAKPGEDATPVKQAFLEQLFGVLREDTATLKQERATGVKDLRGTLAT
ncbi:hypothetical protein NDU88_007902 [Pleurodeles waltl]|uniref:Uncharacterized protein n=1 Tax=Pleurodeles waltl TaxID=8319 RepID=A0AAV7PQM4_PLEWA|nr:hypothetical protein NDU88_007902 [Pleurodeles waltl]